MSRINSQQALMPSMLDRLVDPESGGTAARRGYGLAQMIAAVRRDLEDLLNTRAPGINVPDEFQQLRNSLLNYGMPDFQSVDTSTRHARQQISQMIEEIIERYEPRLRNVRAVMIEHGDDVDRHVRFHIDGRLRAEPSPEVSFETVLELMTGHAQVTQRRA